MDEFFTGNQETALTQEYIQDVLQQWDWMDVQKMVFIYRAVQNGWCVRRLRNGKFEFKMDGASADYETANLNSKWISAPANST
jgi:hypothetical protein